MAFNIPSLSDLITQSKTSISNRLGIAGPALRRSIRDVLGTVMAGMSFLLHSHLKYISDQVLPDTADGDWLTRHGNLIGVTRKGASFASGNVTFTGPIGTTIPAGTILSRNDGEKYSVKIAGTLTTSTISLEVIANKAGSVQNADTSSTMTLESPIVGVSSDVTVDSPGISGGTDQETDESLRNRIRDRLQNPPQGGSETDYINWAKSVSGVTRAFVFPNYGSVGTVGVSFVLDDDPISIIPNATKVQEVFDYIDPLKPVNSTLNVFAPTSNPLDITVKISPNTTDVQNAIDNEIKAMLKREASPGSTILLSHINEAISLAVGEVDHITVSPTADVTQTSTQIATFGTMTYQNI